jgi:hypothetical protein
MILALDSDEGIIKIGSPPEEIPGIVESVKISDSLLIENADMQGRSGKVKVVQGWDDVVLQITLSLIDNPDAKKTCWDYLKQIAGVFKKVAADGKPEVYTVSHPMITAWGTKQLLFSSLETTGQRTRRKVAVSIQFVEYDSIVGVIQERDAAAKKTNKKTTETVYYPVVSDTQRMGMGKLESRFAKL